MRNRIIYISACIAITILFTQCSVKKNTALTRSYHYVKARYNVYFNGNVAFEKGEDAVKKANKDNYTEVLPIYPISNHDAASAASSDMDYTIEKCQKTIKLHSIVKKPKKKPNKSKDPKYKAFMQKEEYNSMVQEAWLLMGKAQFYKLDFTAAGSTFAYIARHFSDNKDVYTEAKLWSARSFSELQWYYEAEDVLNQMNEKTFSPKTNQQYVLVKADLLLKQKHYKEALPYLETALKNAPKREQARISFIYAQVLERLGLYADAYEKYAYTIKKNPSLEMEFNAFLNKTRCYQGSNKDAVKKDMAKLMKKQSNAPYLDQIYYTLGEFYARSGDEAKAIEFYQTAIDTSTRNGIDKAKALLALGDIYYQKEKYIKAQPLYAEALQIIPLNYENYKDLSNRTENLNVIAKNQNIVLLEDSLQALAQLPEAERIKKIEEIIEQQKEKAEAERIKLEEQARIQEIKDQNAAMGQTLSLGELADKSWYFYNQTLISRGKLEFRKTWGRRTLEDDWRRSAKISSTALLNEEEIEDKDVEASEVLVNKSVDDDPILASLPEDAGAELISILKSLPTNEAKIAASNANIEEALHQLFFMFDEKIHNYPLAFKTFEELERRFPKYKELAEDNYRLYKLYKRVGDDAKAEETKQKILRLYADTKYARLLQNGTISDSDAKAKEEALYRSTYAAFMKGDASTVRANLANAEKAYPDSKLMPKFIFLDAISSGRIDGREVFVKRLSDLVSKYPDSEIAPLARDMIALSAQGKELKATLPVSTISERREAVVTEAEFAENIKKAGFQYNPEDSHSFIMIIEGTLKQKNQVVFEVASYNFTRFMIKDFDLDVRTLNDSVYSISVGGLENLDEAIWYQNALLSDPQVLSSLQNVKYKAFAVSDDNYRSIFDKESVEKYLEFYQQNKLEIKEPDKIKELEQSSGFVNP